MANDPQKEALKLAETAHQTQNKFDKGIKKPYSELESMATKATLKERKEPER